MCTNKHSLKKISPIALSQSALTELIEAFRAGDGVDPIRKSVWLVMQESIEAEASEVVDLTATSGPNPE